MLLSRVLVRGGGATEGRNGEWGEHYRGKSCDKKNNGQLARCWCHKHVWPRLSSVSFLLGGCHQHLLKLHSSPQKLHTCPSPSLLPTETSLADSTFGYIDTKSEGKDSYFCHSSSFNPEQGIGIKLQQYVSASVLSLSYQGSYCRTNTCVF